MTKLMHPVPFQAVQLFQTNALNGLPTSLETTFTLKKPPSRVPDPKNKSGRREAGFCSEPVPTTGSLVNLSENPLQTLHFFPDRSNYDSVLINPNHLQGNVNVNADDFTVKNNNRKECVNRE